MFYYLAGQSPCQDIKKSWCRLGGFYKNSIWIKNVELQLCQEIYTFNIYCFRGNIWHFLKLAWVLTELISIMTCFASYTFQPVCQHFAIRTAPLNTWVIKLQLFFHLSAKGERPQGISLKIMSNSLLYYGIWPESTSVEFCTIAEVASCSPEQEINKNRWK